MRFATQNIDLIDLSFDEINQISQSSAATFEDNSMSIRETTEVVQEPVQRDHDDSNSNVNPSMMSNTPSTIVQGESVHEASVTSGRQNTVTFEDPPVANNNSTSVQTPSISRHSSFCQPTASNTSVYVPPPSRYLKTPRKLPSMITMKTVLKEFRPTVPSELRKLRELAVQPLDTKFDLIPLDDSEKQILNNYNLHMRVQDFASNLIKFDMEDVFDVLQFPHGVDSETLLNDNISIQPLPGKRNILECWDQVHESEIILHVKFLRRYGQLWDLQNLDWSFEMLLKSCEVSLANKVRENMVGTELELQCGPMFFYLMMREIISSTEVSVLSMVNRIKSIKLSTFKGENVTLMTGQLRMAIKRLQVLGKVPEDVMKHTLAALQTSSVAKFNGYFSQLENTLRQVSKFSLSTDEIFKMADALYREYLECGDWTAAKYTTPPNAFLTEETPICPRCKKRHKGRCNQTHWKFVPPDDGNPETKTINEKTWFWCGKCRRWNTTHTTTQHVRKKTAEEEKIISPSSVPADSSPPPSLTPSFASSKVSSTTSASANIVSYDASMLDKHRRTLFAAMLKPSE